MADQWRWVEGGLEFDGQMRAFAPLPTDEAFASFVEAVNQIAEARSLLESARVAFLSGAAEYHQGAARVLDLLQGRRELHLLWFEQLKVVAERFQPRPDLSKLTDDDQQRFAHEATLKLAAKMDDRRKAIEAPKGS